MLSPESELFLFRFLNGSIPIEQFENWIYQTDSLEKEIPRQTYLALMDIRYGERDTEYEVRKTLLNCIDMGRFEEWKIRGILGSIIEKDSFAAESIDKCYDLYCSGYNFLEIIALAFGLQLRTISYETSDWRSLPTGTVKHTLSSFYPNVQAEAMRIQGLLDDKKIILTGKRDNSDQKLDYEDNQTPVEREESNFNNYKEKYPS